MAEMCRRLEMFQVWPGYDQATPCVFLYFMQTTLVQQGPGGAPGVLCIPFAFIVTLTLALPIKPRTSGASVTCQCAPSLLLVLVV